MHLSAKNIFQDKIDQGPMTSSFLLLMTSHRHSLDEIETDIEMIPTAEKNLNGGEILSTSII